MCPYGYQFGTVKYCFIGFFHLRNCQVFRSQTNFVRQILELVLTKNSDSTLLSYSYSIVPKPKIL